MRQSRLRVASFRRALTTRVAQRVRPTGTAAPLLLYAAQAREEQERYSVPLSHRRAGARRAVPQRGRATTYAHPSGGTKPCQAFSNILATWIVMRSPYSGPTICTPIGRPAFDMPIGATLAGR